MYQVNQITSDPLQDQRLTLPDGSVIQMQLYFNPQQLCWVMSLVYQGFILNSTQVTNSPNMLRQYQNIIPFGLACFSDSDREPSQQADFESGASKLFVLTKAEVMEYSEFLSG